MKMQLSGGQAFSQLRDKLDATLTVDYDGKAIPLSAARAMAYDADADVLVDFEDIGGTGDPAAASVRTGGTHT